MMKPNSKKMVETAKRKMPRLLHCGVNDGTNSAILKIPTSTIVSHLPAFLALGSDLCLQAQLCTNF